MNNISNKELIKLLLEFGVLKRIVRTGWKNKGIKDPESVAEHSFRVAVIAMLIAKDYSLDQNRVIKMGLIHDLGEIIIGDLIWERGKKVVGSQKDKHIDESKAIEKIFDDKQVFREYVELWKEFGEQKTREALFIKQIDKLEMTLQALEYQKEGYSVKDLQEFWDNAEKYLEGKEVEPIFRELQKLKKVS